MTELDSFVARALALAQHDERRVLFGAAMHNWQHTPVEIADFERAHAIKIPPALKTWLAHYGTGAGPFYGLQLEAPKDGSLVLTEHGCGYFDFLNLESGEVWVDLGESRFKWFDTVHHWLGAWLDYAEAEWTTYYLQEGVEEQTDPSFLARCLRSAQRVVEGGVGPIETAYPLPHLKLLMALVHGAFHDGNVGAGERYLRQAQEIAPPGELIDVLGKIFIAKANGDAAAGLAAAEDGLAREIVNWDVRGKLLREKQIALSALDRNAEHDSMFGEIADHYRHDLHRQYDHAWILLSHNDADGAAERLLVAANNGVGCNDDDPLEKRLRQVASGLEQALIDAGHQERATALRSAITRKLN